MAADSTCSLKFGPDWIRELSDSSAGQVSQSQPALATPPRKYPLAKHRYGKEELIAIFEQTLYGGSVPPLSIPGFVYCDGVYIEQSQTPRSLIPMTDEEQRLWAFQRAVPSRGRGRGISPAPWVATRNVTGHLQQMRNWRSPEKPTLSNLSTASTSSQFNYWRKSSLNEDEKVPEWADEKVSENHDNVGSFDEKGGFLSLENRSKTIEGVVGVSSPGTSFTQRAAPNVEGEVHLQSTIHSNIETNPLKPFIDKPSTSPSASVNAKKGEVDGFNREASREGNEKPTKEAPAGNSSTRPAVIRTQPVSRPEDARSSLAPNKGAQVASISSGGTLNSIAEPRLPEQEATPVVEPDRTIQQKSQWNTPSRDISEAPLWFYKDPQGMIQGPFSSADMLEWSNQGYFHDSLECRRSCDPVFNPLSDLKKLWNGTLPFYLPNLHGPILNLVLPNAPTSSPKISAAFSLSNVSMGLGVNTLTASQSNFNGFLATTNQGLSSSAVPAVSPIATMTSGLCSETAYFEQTNAQFNTLPQHRNDFDGRTRQLPNDSDVGNDTINLVAHTSPTRRVQLEPENRTGASTSLAQSILESSIRRSVHEQSFNQTVNNHMTANSNTTSIHRRGIISTHLIEHVSAAGSSQSTRSTTASTLKQQAESSWFGSTPSKLDVGYRGNMIPQVSSAVDQTAQHRTITQHELPNSWLVQRKNERNTETSSRLLHQEETKHVEADEGTWKDFEYGDQTTQRITSFEDESSQQRPHLRLQSAIDQDQQEAQTQQLQQEQPRQDEELKELPRTEEAPVEKVVEKKKKRDRKEKEKLREERLQREKQEREKQTKQLAQQNSTDEEVDWDYGEQNAGKNPFQDVIIPAPAPAVPAWGKPESSMSALSLQEIQRLEEERASKERQQRQQEAIKNGYHSGIRTWANAIAPTKSFDQIQKEQQASKVTAVQNKQHPKGTPAPHMPPSAANMVANGIGAPHKSSNSKSSVKTAGAAQSVGSGVSIPHNNNNHTTSIPHNTINNNGGEKSVVTTETTSNEQQLIDWCAQITKGLNSYLDMPTVVSILKDVESEAEIEDYVSQFFGDSLKEPRQFARQFVQKRAKFNVGLASSLPKQSEWCTTGSNKKRKSAKK